MLIETTPDVAGKCITAKLITGEEIITHVDSTGSGWLKIVNPLAMVMMPGEEQEGMVVFAPWMLGLEDDHAIIVDLTKVVAYTIARRDAAQKYYSAIGEPSVVEESKSAPQILTGARKGGRGR